MSPPAIPEEVLDGIAARPEDSAAWEVLTDFLLEHDLPGATLARCDLELMKGISNPDLLGALAQARAERPKLPFEPYGGYDDCVWRCGWVVKFEVTELLETSRLGEVAAAPAMRGLHHLRFDDGAATRLRRDPSHRVARLEALLRGVTPHLRRLSIELRAREEAAPDELDRLLAALEREWPPNLTRLDLAFGALRGFDVTKLGAVASRVDELNLDGTSLADVRPATLQVLVEAAPHCTYFFAGTGRSPRTWSHPRVRWELPEAVASLEDVQSGVVVPITPRRAHDHFRAPAWPGLERVLYRDLMGWWTVDHGRRLQIDDGALLAFSEGEWLFRRGA